jgi:hypothetical protein
MTINTPSPQRPLAPEEDFSVLARVLEMRRIIAEAVRDLQLRDRRKQSPQ